MNEPAIPLDPMTRRPMTPAGALMHRANLLTQVVHLAGQPVTDERQPKLDAAFAALDALPLVELVNATDELRWATPAVPAVATKDQP